MAKTVEELEKIIAQKDLEIAALQAKLKEAEYYNVQLRALIRGMSRQ